MPLVLCCFAFSRSARAETITFEEIVLPNGTPVTNQYAAYGVTFTNTVYETDDLFVDDRGVAEKPEPSTIDFLTPAGDVTLNWVAISTDFQASAYDGSGNLLGTFSSATCNSSNGTPDVFPGFYDCKGSVEFVASDIEEIVWHDSVGFVGLDSIHIPEPSYFIPFLALMAGVCLLQRARRANSIQA